MQSSTGTKWKLAPVIISGHLYIFKALLFLERFHFSSAFISWALLFLERFYSRALLFSSAFISRAPLHASERFCFPSAFIFRALLFSEHFHFVFQMWVSAYLFSLSVSQHLFIFSKCESALIYFLFTRTLFSSYFNFWMRSAQISWS